MYTRNRNSSHFLFLAGTSIQQPQQLITSPTAGGSTVVSGATGSCPTTAQQLTIQLPTQPQPIQGVKTVTYVNPVLSTPATRPTQIQTSPTVTAATTTLQPVKLATPTFAYTSSGGYLIHDERDFVGFASVVVYLRLRPRFFWFLVSLISKQSHETKRAQAFPANSYPGKFKRGIFTFKKAKCSVTILDSGRT